MKSFFLVIFIIILNFNLLFSTEFYGRCFGISEYSDFELFKNDEGNRGARIMHDRLIYFQGWNENNVEYFTQDQVTKYKISQEILYMPKSTGNTDLFYFCGHGSTSGILTFDDNWISPQELQNYLTYGNQDYNQFCCFIDCRSSGTFANQMTRGVISTATEHGDDKWSTSNKNYPMLTYYTQFLAWEGLKDHPENSIPGHVLSVQELHQYVKSRFEEVYPSQKPQFKDHIGVLNFKNLGPTTSGTIEDDELWDQNVTLSGPVTVPNGKTLVIYDVTVNLNNYYICCTGSGKIV